jgi:hypothetical protein
VRSRLGEDGANLGVAEHVPLEGDQARAGEAFSEIAAKPDRVVDLEKLGGQDQTEAPARCQQRACVGNVGCP